MSDWTDPVPPDHGEPENVPTLGSDKECWCGRPLRPVSPVFKNGLTGRARPTCDVHGWAHFAVQQVFADGNPETVFVSTDLRRAVEHADDLRITLRMSHHQSFVGVYDEDDPERGWLGDPDG